MSVRRTIKSLGCNYAAHAKELWNAVPSTARAKELRNPVPKEPVWFVDLTSSYLKNGRTFEIPEGLESLDHKVELAVVMGQEAHDVPEATAMDYVAGYQLAVHMTAREFQVSAKSAGLPWKKAKGRDFFTALSSFIPKSAVLDPHNLELWLKVDEEIRQKGSTADMIFKIPFLISHYTSYWAFYEGDVFLTGTPQGVGPVKAGQKITAGITGLVDVHFDVGLLENAKGPRAIELPAYIHEMLGQKVW